MTLGICGARCDPSGLAVISQEIFRALSPDRTLLLNLNDRGRGECFPSAYDVYGSTYQQVYPADFAGGLAERAIEWITAEGITTLLGIETFYADERVLTEAHRAGIRTVLYAMPELHAWSVDPGRRPRPRTVYVPTGWRAESVPGAQVLPMPVARDRLPFRARESVTHLFHPTGAAMLDRNGSDILLRALPHVQSRLRVTIRAEKPIDIPACRCDVEVVTDATMNYWESYPADADLLVLPRRYGGLALPVQECASLGIPALMLDCDPYRPYGFVHCIPTTRARNVSMKGCVRPGIPVFDADPRVLAQAIDWLVEHPDRIAPASHAADAWAEAHAWHGPLGDRWCSLLEANCDVREEAA